MQNNNFLNQIILGDSLEILSKIEDNSIDIVLTDPPYFLDKLDNNWQYKKVEDTRNQQIIKSLPAGMKFDRKQGQEFYKWYLIISEQIYRILKPGGFFFSFSSPRLYHRMASAVDDAGLEIRDCFLWLYTQNQAKAMSVNHFIDKMEISDKEKKGIKEK
ncbi:site-specific DNA-methyltransferase, partial [Patescibacteria group bacterium]|nr:site-specific DNA-methyltransferase [Patescibacteria group bacterium]